MLVYAIGRINEQLLENERSVIEGPFAEAQLPLFHRRSAAERLFDLIVILPFLSAQDTS